MPLAACSSPSPTGPQAPASGTEAAPSATATEAPPPATATEPPASGTAPETPGGTPPAPPAATSCRDSTELIAGAEWVQRDGQSALRVVPGESLRGCGLAGGADPAWEQLLALVPEADTPGMAEQFECHVLFAPGQELWHLEPWRPAVDRAELIRARCNPEDA